MEAWFTQHRGQPDYSQQDALLLAGDVFQSPDLPVSSATISEDVALLAVADGVSGSPAADRASRIILELIAAASHSRIGLVDAKLIREACETFRERLARGRTYGAATTLALLHIHGRSAAVVNCGDSRVYRIRDGEWRQLSKDHTMLAELKACGELGDVDPSDVASIYKGLAHCIVADPIEANVRIHSRVVDIHAGDIVLITTDGIHETLDGGRLQNLYDPALPLPAQIDRWRDAVFAAGAPDNFSLIALKR